VQTGLEELHRHAHAYRVASERLAQVRALTGEPELSPDRAPARLEAAREEKARLDRELLRLDRESEHASAQRADFDAAFAALRALDPEATPSDAHARARAALSRLSDLEHLSTREPALTSALHEARSLALKQAAVRARVLALRDHDEAHPEKTQVEPAEVRAELEAAEQELTELREQRAEAERDLELSRRAAKEAEQRASELEAKSRELLAATATLSRITGSERTEPWTAAAVRELEGRLLEERETLRAREGELERERERALRRAAELESEFGGIDPELLTLRDELDAELLSSRYDELEPEEAAVVQARLGDLTRALVVPDPEEAARKLAGTERQLGTVWLVGPGFTGPNEPEIVSGDALVREGGAVRVTRLAPRPVLGRAARARRARELLAEAERLGAELEANEQRLRRLDGNLSELRALSGKPALFELDDPAALAEEQRSEQARYTSHVERLRLQIESASLRATALEAKIRDLRSVLPDLYLLESRDQAAYAEELARELEACERAKAELSRAREPRATLSTLLEALRQAPPSAEEVSRREAERQSLIEARDRAFSLAEALADLVSRRADLAWEQAERALSERTELVPALEEQQRKARQVLDASEAALAEAEREWEHATSVWQRAEAEWSALEAHRKKQAEELEKEGIGDHSDSALALADQLVESCRQAHAASTQEERAAATEVALLEERHKQLAAIVERARSARAASRDRARPATEGLEALRRALAERGLERLEREAESHAEGSAGALLEARTQREILVERVSAARHGAELASELKALFAKEATAETYLEAWLSVRAWLSRRIPAQIAQGADPLEGLERLRDHLAALERRLARQENDLRGASEDIARGVEAQLRRAKNQVRRLQQSLMGLGFGNIQGIRVQMKRIERMDQILTALKKGAAQEFLFQRGLPIEEALNEVFRRYGGGKTGGARLLDYREYVELEVEIQRRGSELWEPANATRLSTGEAIGVGAALMMVVLTEWERDANLFRGRREHGSLRFLFLDEANRLSHDNLGTLFDLCKTLDLQLLIAAPEVARAEGNTTYRLVRTVTSDGREEVIVSGRRATGEAAQA
jgi:chromosome partition protein MukB